MPARIVRVVVGLLFFVVPIRSILAVVFSPISLSQEHPIIGESFVVDATASGATVGSVYFLKCRIGQTTNALTEGQTYNSSTAEWLNDTDAWVSMPTVSVGEDGSWNGTVSCRVKLTAADELKVLYLRTCLRANDACGSSVQSTAFLTFAPIAPSPTAAPTQTPCPTATPTTVPTGTSTPTSGPSVVLSPVSKPTSFVRVIATVMEEETDMVEGAVLGARQDDTDTATTSSMFAEKRPYIRALLVTGIGLAILAAVWLIKIRYTKI